MVSGTRRAVFFTRSTIFCDERWHIIKARVLPSLYIIVDPACSYCGKETVTSLTWRFPRSSHRSSDSRSISTLVNHSMPGREHRLDRHRAIVEDRQPMHKLGPASSLYRRQMSCNPLFWNGIK